MHRNGSIPALTAIFLVSSTAWAQQGPVVAMESWDAWENGGFFHKTIKELGSDEVRYAITAVCALYGTNCSQQAAVFQQWSQQASRITNTGNAITTAWIDKHPGEEYYAKFLSPSGYTICKASVDVKNGSITGGATFNASIQRSPPSPQDGLGLYVVVPKNRPSGQWAKFNSVVTYVPVGALQQHGCWPDNLLVVQCTGNNCNTPPGYPVRIP